MFHRGTLGVDGCGIINLLAFLLYPFLAENNRRTDCSRCRLSEPPPISLDNGFPPGTRPASERIASAGCLSGAARSHSPRRLAPVPLGPRRAGILRLAAEETGNGRLVLLLSEIFGEAAVLLSRRFRLPANVRLWLEADIQPHPELRPLYPRKRTFARQSKKVCF